MPGGQFDSSKTRVAPVFNALRSQPDWVRRLLELCERPGLAPGALDGLDLNCQKWKWSPSEQALDPPVALLSWLIRNVDPRKMEGQPEKRRQLGARDPAVVQEALKALRASSDPKAWYVLEGQTCPDAYIETPDALIVVEGKRTEAGPTTDTTYLEGRHQIWRHIDAAWEIRGHRRVFGVFVVEGEGGTTALPPVWQAACERSLTDEVLESSFPHRSGAERAAIARCFVGATTWQALCAGFALPPETLPHAVGDATTQPVP